MKKFIFLFLLLISLVPSFSQTFIGLNYNCYSFNFSNTTNERLNCDLEICITQDIECPSCTSIEGVTTPSYVSRVVNCFIITSPSSTPQICFYDTVSAECGCEIIYTNITIRRINTGEIITVPNVDTKDFLDIIKGQAALSLTLPSFSKDCNNKDYVNTLAVIGTIGGMAQMITYP